MGGRSKSKSVDTSKQTQSTMDSLAKGKVSNYTMLDILSQLQNSQMGGMLPIFDALMSNANSRFDNHPMMSFFGVQQAPPPQQFLTDAWLAQQPQPQPPMQQPQAGGMGQTGIGAMPRLTPQQMQDIRNGRRGLLGGIQ